MFVSDAGRQFTDESTLVLPAHAPRLRHPSRNGTCGSGGQVSYNLNFLFSESTLSMDQFHQNLQEKDPKVHRKDNALLFSTCKEMVVLSKKLYNLVAR